MLRMIEDDDVEDDGVQEDDVENDAAEDDVEEEDRSHFVRTCTVKMHLIPEEPPILRKFTDRGLLLDHHLVPQLCSFQCTSMHVTPFDTDIKYI